MGRRVAITGVGAVTPLGVGAEVLIDRWIAGESGIEDGIGRCLDFDPADYLSRKEARRTHRFTQLALVAAAEALGQAGWDEQKLLPAEEVGCVIGSSLGGVTTIEEQHDVLRERGAGAVSPLTVPLVMSNAPAALVAMRHDFRGQSFGVVSSCATGAYAIGVGLRMIQHGDARACLVGGTDGALTPIMVAAGAEMGATSPTGIARPFDRRRDGFIPGEGAATMMLEEESAALERDAEVLGYVTGYGATSDAYHITAPEPSGREAARAMELALRDAGVEPGEVGYVNAHGTGTPVNDRVETAAIKQALGPAAMSVAVSSTKSAIGHLMGAAGAVETVATLLALRRRVAPPTLNLEEPDPELDLNYVPLEAQPLEGNGRPLIALKNSFGLGGHNAVLCIEVP